MQVAAAFQPPPTRADYYDYQQRTQRMGPQTMMGSGVAPTTVSQYPQGSYPQGYNDGNGYENGDGEQGGGSRRWLPWTIAGVVLVAAIVAAVLLLHGGGGGSFVPTALVGEPQATAVAQVKTAGLNPSVVQQSNATVTPGNVISTNPSPGSSISKGGTVTLYVSKGAAPILLPNVQNEQYNAAAQQLRNLGFTNVDPVADNQSSLPAGEVDHMSPTPNQKYAPSETITLYYSGGGITVPTLTGVPLSTAVQELKSAGFTSAPSVTYADGPVSQNIPVGTVWKQFPATGNVPPNTVITLFVQQTAATPTTSATPSVTPSVTPSDTPSSTATPTGTPTTAPPGG
jgi:serine/threonine-protein kinase